jgi:hypothetical protein
VLRLLHDHRKAFFIANGLLIVGFASPGVISPEAFWGWLGAPVMQPMFVRLASWYLLVHGIGALLIAHEPDCYPPVIWMLGLEKAGAVTVLSYYLGFHLRPQLAIVGLTDTILSALLLYYASALSSRSRIA